MTTTPGQDSSFEYSAADQVAPGQSSPRRKRTALIAGGAALAVAAGVGGAVAVTSVLGGGGAQPEDFFPGETAAFAKIDLDPSSGQKLDAVRFMRKFPALSDKITGDDSDLRKAVFEGVQGDGQFEGLNYATDIEPWLGQRFAVGVVPGEKGEEPIPVTAIAITDQGKAQDALPKLVAGSGTETKCSVGEEFIVCAEDQAKLDAVLGLTEKSTLAQNKTFAQDLDGLGESGIVAGWADMDRLKKLVPAGEESGIDSEAGLDQFGGRQVAVLRFDGPNLELAGQVKGLPEAMQIRSQEASVDMFADDTLAVFSIGGLGEGLAKAWPQLEKAVGAEELDQMTGGLGITLPDDIVAALGTRVSFGFGGGDLSSELPKLALVTDGDPKAMRALVDEGAAQADAWRGEVPSFDEGEEPPLDEGSDPEASPSAPVFFAEGGDNLVVASTQEYADAVTKSSGLASSKRFTTAVPDAKGASALGFADIAAIVDQYAGAVMEESETDTSIAANLKPLGALGFSARMDGADGNYTVRLTTR